MSTLFLSPDRHAEWQRLLAQADATALSIRHALFDRLPGGPGQANESDRALHQICLAWLEGDRDLADLGAASLLQLQAADTPKDLGKASQALALALAWDFGKDLWTDTRRREVVDRLFAIARSFFQLSADNPHAVTNNWWMLTHGGCLLACLAAHGEEGSAGAVDLAAIRDWALGRFRAFCVHFGNAGLYHEGSGYIGYTLSMLMPVLVALRNRLGLDLTEEFPELRRSIPSILVGTAAFQALSDTGETDSGASLQWNDAGRGCATPNPLLPGILVAPEAWRGGLRTIFDRLVGVEGPANWNCGYRGLPMAVALYPFDIPRADPEGRVPKAIWDHRQGLGMWRDAWGRGRENVIGWYARSTHVGGHSQEDAASLRLMGLGRTWICGGGQARGKAEWQSVLTPVVPPEKRGPHAHVTYCEQRADGGVVAMDTRGVLQVYSERYLAWRSADGQPFAFALMDLVDEHQNPPRAWHWNLSFPRDLDATVHEDGLGFNLADAEKGTLVARFVAQAPSSLALKDMPDSRRTFSGGHTVQYPGDRFAQARFEGTARTTILLLAVLVPAGQPLPDLAWEGRDARLGATRWENVFGASLLPAVLPGQSIPNLMKFPEGVA